MKKIIKILACVTNTLKKFFFNKSEVDISHDCEKVLEMADKPDANPAEMEAEEYINSYTSATRWQTV